MKKEQNLVLLKKQASKIEVALAIRTKEDMIIAVDQLGKVKTFLKSIQEKKKEIKESINFLMLPIQTMEKRAIEIEKEIKDKMLSWQLAQEAKAEKKIEQIETKIESGELSFEKGVAKMENLEPEVKVETESFSLKFREDRKMEITDSILVPDEYWVIDEVKLRKDVLAGKEIPGTKIIIIKTPVSARV